MVSTVERRLEQLERDSGGDCERCGGSTIVWGPGCDYPAVNRRGVRFGLEASWQFYREEQPGGVCPVCAGVRENVTVKLRPDSSFYRPLH